MTDTIKQVTLWLATGTEAIAGVLIAVAVVEAAIRAAGVAMRLSERPIPARDRRRLADRIWAGAGIVGA